MNTEAKVAAIKAHYARKPDYAVEKALRGEAISADDYAHGTLGLPREAFMITDEGHYRLTADALRVAEEAQSEG